MFYSLNIEVIIVHTFLANICVEKNFYVIFIVLPFAYQGMKVKLIYRLVYLIAVRTSLLSPLDIYLSYCVTKT